MLGRDNQSGGLFGFITQSVSTQNTFILVLNYIGIAIAIAIRAFIHFVEINYRYMLSFTF